MAPQALWMALDSNKQWRAFAQGYSIELEYFADSTIQ